jgi:hypothetical protein
MRRTAWPLVLLVAGLAGCSPAASSRGDAGPGALDGGAPDDGGRVTDGGGGESLTELASRWCTQCAARACCPYDAGTFDECVARVGQAGELARSGGCACHFEAYARCRADAAPCPGSGAEDACQSAAYLLEQCVYGTITCP